MTIIYKGQNGLEGILDYLNPFSSSSTPKTYTDAEKREAGINGFKYFHNASVKYPNYVFKTNDEFVAYIDKLSPTFVKSYGSAIVGVDYKQAELKITNEALAKKAQGAVPPNSTQMQVFIEAIQEDVGSVSTALWKSVETFKAGVETIAKTAAVGLAGYATYKIAAVAVAGLTALSVIIMAFKKKKSKR